MPPLPSAPDAEDPETKHINASGTDAADLDEPAARRSGRSLVIVTTVVLVSGVAGFLVSLLGTDRANPQHSPPLWAIVLLVVVSGVVLGATVLLMRWQSGRPANRRVLQYGRQRRRRVVKDLLHGRTLSAQDLPVATAMVSFVRAQRRQQVILYCLLPVIFVFNGLIQHGALRWFQLGLALLWMALVPFKISQQRRMVRNYDRQGTAP